MSDSKMPGLTTDEKVELLGEVIANIILFLQTKYPDFHQESKAAREKYSEEIVDKLSNETMDVIMKKLKGEE